MASEGGLRATVTALLLFASLALAGPALAEPTAQEKERARDLMAEGRELRDAHDLPAALKSFEAADAIMHVPTTGYEVAKTQQALGFLLEAQKTALAVTKIPATATDPPPFVEARSKAEALLRELATQIPTLKVTVAVNDSAASSASPTVMLDEQAVSLSEGPLRVNPGRHLLVARARGATDTMATVNIAAGETKEIALRLDVGPDAEPRPVTETTTKGPIPLVSWIAFGTAAAGLAVGSIAGIVALSEESDLASRCNGNACPRSVESDLDGARTVATVSTVGFVIAGIGAAVGVVGIVAARRASPPSAGALHPIRMTANGAGIGIRF